MEQVNPYQESTQDKQPLWKITNITPDTEFTANGIVRGKVVHYSVLDNMSGTVFIPDNEFHADKVQSMVHKIAVQMVQTMGLEGPDINQPTQPVYTFTPGQQ